MLSWRIRFLAIGVILISLTLQIPIVSSFSAEPPPPPSPPPPPGIPAPEVVVAEQLLLLQNRVDIPKAYQQYFSAISRFGTGDSWQAFDEELQDEIFLPLTQHSSATVVMTVQLEPTHTNCLVRIMPTNHDSDKDNDNDNDNGIIPPGKHLIPVFYWWGLVLEEEGLKMEKEDVEENFGDLKKIFETNSTEEKVWKIESVIPDFESMEVEVRVTEDDDDDVYDEDDGDTFYLDEDGNEISKEAFEEGDDDDDDDDDDGSESINR